MPPKPKQKRWCKKGRDFRDVLMILYFWVRDSGLAYNEESAHYFLDQLESLDIPPSKRYYEDQELLEFCTES